MKLYVKSEGCEACKDVEDWIITNKPELMSRVFLVNKDEDQSYKLFYPTVPCLVMEYEFVGGSKQIKEYLATIK